MACEEISFVTAERHGWLMKVSHLHWLKAMNIQEVLTLPSGQNLQGNWMRERRGKRVKLI